MTPCHSILLVVKKTGPRSLLSVYIIYLHGSQLLTTLTNIDFHELPRPKYRCCTWRNESSNTNMKKEILRRRQNNILKIKIEFLSTKIHIREDFPVKILSINLSHDQNRFKFLPSLSCQPSQCFPKNLMEALTIRMQTICPVSSCRLFVSLLCIPWYKRTQDLGGHLQNRGGRNRGGEGEIIDIFAPN